MDFEKLVAKENLNFNLHSNQFFFVFRHLSITMLTLKEIEVHFQNYPQFPCSSPHRLIASSPHRLINSRIFIHISVATLPISTIFF
jgi:hypothetical protein